MADAISKTKAPVAVLEYEPSGFEQTLIKHKSKLILVGIIAVAGTLGYWGWRLYGEASNKSAAVAFARAETVNDLKSVAEKHAGKPGAGSALVLAAEKLSAERPGEAIGVLKDFLAKNEKHPLRDLAAFRIAEYYAASGDPGSAEKEYDAVAKAATPFSAFAILRLGDLKWAAGDNEKARDYYDQILKNSSMSGSPARTAAQSRMDRALKIKAPVLVEYKAGTPPASPGTSDLNVQGLGDFGAPERSPSDSLLPPPQLSPSPPRPPAPQPGPPPVPGPDAVPAPAPVPVPAPENLTPPEKDAKNPLAPPAANSIGQSQAGGSP